ncbi:GNAT family N-acetyltransferase [Streptomyces canus]|uniref:GNAT family N-acetyltransferase n=1 Tax=Streptomyces canus TaxID=58343 RepID=UPI0032513545
MTAARCPTRSAGPHRALFAAHEKGGGAFIGWFWAAWGEGYATEGSRALLDKAFAGLGVRMVWAETMAVNRGSRNVMAKLAMTLTDTIPTPPDMEMIEGSEYGGVRYEITKEQRERL